MEGGFAASHCSVYKVRPPPLSLRCYSIFTAEGGGEMEVRMVSLEKSNKISELHTHPSYLLLPPNTAAGLKPRAHLSSLNEPPEKDPPSP